MSMLCSGGRRPLLFRITRCQSYLSSSRRAARSTQAHSTSAAAVQQPRWRRNEPTLLWTATLLSLSLVAWHTKPMLPTTGPSMLPTVLVRDGVVWSPWHRRGRGVAVGDVVAARSPYEPGEAVVKRVLGMPGDVVCVLRLDREELGEALQVQSQADTSSEQQWPGAGRAMDRAKYIVVPHGHCWVEGDNPPWSVDSRHYGPLPLGLIVGKVVAIRGLHFWSWRWVGGQQLAPVDNDLIFNG